MFEKEAEKKYCNGCKWRIEQCLWAWRQTNGLKEPNEKNCSCKEVPAYLAGAEFGYNKANEWHYMKDVNCYEDLPHNEDVYYAYVVNVGAYDKPTIERKLGCFAEFEFDVMAYHVIAWKEIVLPELKESE